MSQTKKPPVPKSFGAYIEILAPAENSAVLVKNYDVGTQRGEIVVQVQQNNPDVYSVLAEVRDASASAPTAAAGTDLGTPTDGVFEKTDFAVTNLPQAGPSANNKTLYCWARDKDGNTLGGAEAVSFAAVPNPCTLTVDAKNCIWLTYAEPSMDPLQPDGEHARDGSPYVPAGVRIPHGATTVQVQASAGSWSHDPKAPSGPDGITGSEQDLAKPEVYKDRTNAKLHSERIFGQRLKLNLLVGLREYQAHGTEDTTEIAIGSGATFDVVPTGGTAQPYRLRLAMHDGYQWSNNNGQIAVTITFAE